MIGSGLSAALSHPAIQLSFNRGLSKSVHSRTYPSVVSFAGRAIRCSSLDPTPKSKLGKLVGEFYDDSRKGFAKTIGQAIANDVYENIIKHPHVNNTVTGLYNFMRKIAVCHPIICCVVMTLGIGVLVSFMIKKTFEDI